MQSDSPLISIIIPAYNQARYLQQAIDSALAQTYARFEIIVVNDGSTDETASLATNYGDRIHYIYQENRGLAGARNTGIRAAQGEYVALLDSDDFWLPKYLEVISSLIAKHPGAAVYYGAAQCIDEDGNILPQQVGAPIKPINTPQEMYKALRMGNFLIPSTITLRRQVIVDAGFFDESLKSIGVEDWDLWLRLLPDYQFIGTNAILVCYRIHPKSLSANPAHMQDSVREVIEKHFGADDGLYTRWPAEKRKAYGGLYRNYVVTTILRIGDWHACRESLARALRYDPSLSVNLNFFYDLALGSQPFGYRGTNYQLDIENNAAHIKQLLLDVFAAADNRELKPLEEKTIGTAYYALGLVAYNTKHRSLCRRFVLRALRLRPELWRNLALLKIFVKSYFSDSLLSKLRKMRGSGGRV